MAAVLMIDWSRARVEAGVLVRRLSPQSQQDVLVSWTRVAAEEVVRIS